MSTAAGEQKASRYYPAEEEALMKKVCAEIDSSTALRLLVKSAAELQSCDMLIIC